MPPLSDWTRFWRDLQTLFPIPIQTHFVLLIFLPLSKPKNPAKSFSTISFSTGTTAHFHLNTKSVAERKTINLFDEDEPLQTDPVLLSSDEDFESQYQVFDQNQTNDNVECWPKPSPDTP